MDNKFLIIDGYGFIFRAYYVQPPLSSVQGEPVGAIYGFTSMLIKLISDFNPKHAIVVFDSGGKNFRHELSPDYKIHRPPIDEDLAKQLPFMEGVAQNLGFKTISKVGYEADDIIATIAVNVAKNTDKETIIISSDKDLFQLMTDNIKVYDPVKLRYITNEIVMEKYGVMPSKLREVMAIIGDKADNIIGVHGIGPKGACKLINEFGSVDALLNSLDKIENVKIREKIISSKDMLKLSWKLVGLDINADINLDYDNLLLEKPNKEVIINFLDNYGFKSLYKRIETLFSINLKDDNTSSNEVNVAHTIKQINVISELKNLLEESKKIGILSLFVVNDKQRQAIIIVVNNISYIIDVYDINKDTSLEEFINIILIYLKDESIKKITINIKSLYQLFNITNIAQKLYIHDIELMEYLLSGCTFKGYDIKLSDTATIVKISSTIYEVYNNLLQKLANEKLLNLYTNIDIPLAYVLYQMETIGVKIDHKYLQELSKEFEEDIKILEKSIFEITNTEFNIASVKQLGEVLFDKMRLPFAKVSNKSGTYTTDSEVLEKLSEHGYVVADLLLKWRELNKLKSTYTDGLQNHITHLSRIHTTFLQNSTATSRLSSVNPNLQNIPIRTTTGNKLRRAFVAKEGHILISADYSQIELRILSHIAGIQKLQEAFKINQDIHALTASRIFNIPIEQVTKEHRRQAKAINFGIIYGISGFGLSKQIDITVTKANEYIKQYLQEYEGITHYMQSIVEYAQKNGYVVNLFGRKSNIPEINDKNSIKNSFAKRMAINAPIQSTSADMIKIAMIKIFDQLKQKNLKTKLILQIHDELVFEAQENELHEVSLIIKNIMESSSCLNVPVIVDIKYGNNWQNMSPLNI